MKHHKRKQKRGRGIGLIIGSIPLLLIGICFIDIYFSNIPRLITDLNLELIEFPEYAIEIQSELRTTITTGIILWVIIVSLITTSIVILIMGIKRKKMNNRK